jgi:hypothetical protein
MTTLELTKVSQLATAILDDVETAVIGKREPLTMVLSGILAGGHMLLAHRVAVKPDLWMSNASGASVVASVLSSVPTLGALEADAAPAQ